MILNFARSTGKESLRANAVTAFLAAFYVFLVIEDILEKWIPYIRYYDELVTIILSALLVIRLIQKIGQIGGANLKILSSLLAVILLGLVSTAIHRIQLTPAAISTEILSLLKYPVGYVAPLMFDRLDRDRLLAWCAAVSRIIVSVIFTAMVAAYAMGGIGMLSSERFGIPSFQFLFSHVTYLASSMVVVSTVLTSNGIRKNWCFIAMSNVIGIMTFRYKFFFFIAIMIGLVLLKALAGRKDGEAQKPKLWQGALLGGAALLTGWGQIREYLGYGVTAVRSALYIYGLDIMKKFFPFGSGFATFASGKSCEYYSPLYREYGMDQMQGITKGAYNFIGDVFWPMIYAQYGIAALLAYLYMLYATYRSLCARFVMMSAKWIAAVAFLLYYLFASLGEALFVNGNGLILGLVLSLYIGSSQAQAEVTKRPKSSKRRLMFIVGGLYGGGAERVLTILANRLASDYEVMICPFFLKTENEYPVHNEIQVKALNEQQKWRRILKMRRLMRDFRPDAVISFEYFINMQAIIARLGLPIRLIVSERNDPAREGGAFPKKQIRNLLYPFADALVCQTEDARAYFPRVIRKKALVIPNPINPNLPEPFSGQRKKTVIAFGRLTEQKNFPMLISAFRRFHDRHGDYRLEIYGDGDLLGRIEAQIHELGLDDCAAVYGNTPDIFQKAHECGMFIMTSNYEGISNSMLEAMAMGLPCVVTDCPCGGARMAIRNRKNGLLIPTNDVEACFRAMCRIAEDKCFAKKLSKEAAKIRTRWSLDRIAQAWIDVIDSNPSNHRRPLSR